MNRKSRTLLVKNLLRLAFKLTYQTVSENTANGPPPKATDRAFYVEYAPLLGCTYAGCQEPCFASANALAWCSHKRISTIGEPFK